MNGLLAHNETYYQAVARNIFLNEQFFEVHRIFSRENIAVVPLKGVALIQNVYHDISQRYFGDIDILVKPKDVPKAAVILESLGYTHPRINFNPQKPYSIYLNSVVFFRQPCDVNYSVHLHWHLLNSTLPFFMYRLAMDDIWACARIERTKEGDLVMMAPYHLLIYLSLHAYQHSFDNPGLFQDIKKVIEFYRSELDWSLAADCSRRWNACMPFYIALYLTSRICGADIPEGIMLSVKPKRISKNGHRAISVILKNGRGWQNVAYPLFLDMTDSFRDKGKFVFLSFFPPPAEISKIHAFNFRISVFGHYLKRCGWGISQMIKFLFGSRV